MGIFDIFKKRKDNNAGLNYPVTMNGALPVYSSFGDFIYASDIIVQSIRCKANEFKKLNPRHVRYKDGGFETVEDSTIARVLKRPNDYMTTADFLEKITILLELNKNVYIYPTYYMTNAGDRYYTGLYPLKPSSVAYLQDASGKLFINFTFANGNDVTVPNDSVIHWRKDYGVNDYFGGSMFGGNDDEGLLKMLQRYDKLTQSIGNAIDASYAVNGVIQYQTYLDEDKYLKAQAEFEAKLAQNKSGFMFLDQSYTFTHIPRDGKIVDKETLDFFYKTILRANGTSLPILNGDYTKAQKEAYYEHAIEADLKSLGQAMSKTLFTDREASYGNEIVFYPNEINFMSMENKIAALKTGLPAGIFTKDEARELLGYPPLPNGAGKVVPQGYNSLLDDENNNELQGTNNNDGNIEVNIDEQ